MMMFGEGRAMDRYITFGVIVRNDVQGTIPTIITTEKHNHLKEKDATLSPHFYRLGDSTSYTLMIKRMSQTTPTPS